MKIDNSKVINYFNGIANRLQKYKGGKEIGKEIFEKRTRLAKDNKGARTNARIDAMRRGEEFDESNTPKDELKTMDEDVINELITREIDNIFGD